MTRPSTLALSFSLAIAVSCFAVGAAAAAPLTDRELQTAAARLGSSNFRQREEATRALAEAGLPAISYVEAASRSNNAETRNRGLRILSGWLNSSDRQLASAAEQALRSAAHAREPLTVTAGQRLSANLLRQEAEFVAELDWLVPLKNLLLL